VAEFYEEKTNPIEKPRFNCAGYQVKLKDLNGEKLPLWMKLTLQPSKRGGTRIGADRKPSGNKPVLLRLIGGAFVHVVFS
jgi:hypothetical protein